MASRLTVYTNDTSDTLHMRRNIATALQRLGVNDADSERVLAFYASDIQHIVVPPPPLPPRLRDWETQDTVFSEIKMPLCSEVLNSTTSTPILPQVYDLDAERVQPVEILPHLSPRAQSCISASLASHSNSLTLVSSEVDPESAHSTGIMSPSSYSTQDESPNQGDTKHAPEHFAPDPFFAPDLDSLISKPQLHPSIRFLLVATKGGNSEMIALLAQGYLELLRALTASSGGAWMFHSVQSICLNVIKTSYPSKNHSRHIVDVVQKEFLAEDHGYARLKEPITNALYWNDLRKLDANEFLDYDFIFIWDQRQFTELAGLFDNAGSSEWREAFGRRAVVLSGVDTESLSLAQDLASPVCESIRDFLQRSFYWSAPVARPNSIFTDFVRVTLDSMEKSSDETWETYKQGTVQQYFGQVERASGCKLYLSHHACQYQSEVVAVVGSMAQSAIAKKRLHSLLTTNHIGRVEGSLL